MHAREETREESNTQCIGILLVVLFLYRVADSIWYWVSDAMHQHTSYALKDEKKYAYRKLFSNEKKFARKTPIPMQYVSIEKIYFVKQCNNKFGVLPPTLYIERDCVIRNTIESNWNHI